MGCEYLGFDSAIVEKVNAMRLLKLLLKSGQSPPDRKRRRPRFSVVATVSLCPRQRESKKYGESGE